MQILHLGDLTELVLDGTFIKRISQSIAYLPLARIVQQTLLIRIHHLGTVGPHTGVGLGRAAFQCLPLRHQLSRMDLLSLPLGIICHGLVAAHGVDLFCEDGGLRRDVSENQNWQNVVKYAVVFPNPQFQTLAALR